MILIKKYWYWIVIIILSGLLIYEWNYERTRNKYYDNCLKEALSKYKNEDETVRRSRSYLCLAEYKFNKMNPKHK